MSKGQGKYIVIKFTEDLIGDIANTNISYFAKPNGIMTASRQDGGTVAANAFDGNINTYWYSYGGGASQYIQVRLPKITKINGFRWINNVGYRPKDFKIQGSVNGSTWIDIFNGINPNSDNFQTFTFPEVSYEYYRWTFLNYYNSYIQLAELEISIIDTNRAAFKIKGQQKQHINGALIDGDYRILEINRYQNFQNTILLTMEPLYRFNNIENNISVIYDSQIGNLTGLGGFVESFEVSFTPEDLEKMHNPAIAEHFSVTSNAIINHIKVTYLQAYDTEKITVTASAVVNHINTKIINP